MNKDALKYVIRQSVDRKLPAVFAREVVLPLTSGKIVALIGIRRSGKTFLMFDAIHRLVAQGVDRRQILYLNFEDDRLYPTYAGELDLILTAHGELFPDFQATRRYVFLDEVQVVPGWERYARRLLDTEDVTLCVSGSSSDMLTRQLAPALRGRSIGLEVGPLSFREVLRFRNVALKSFRKTDEALALHLLEEYVQWGGLPEIVMAPPEMRPLIIAEYASLIFFKDIVERYGIKNEMVMKLLVQHCALQPSSLLSINKLYGDFRSRGLQCSKNTLYEYLHNLEDAGVVFRLPIHDPSLRRQAQNPHKIHLVDTGLIQAYAADPGQNLGHRLETVVFLHERRRPGRFFYFKNGFELDLVVERQGQLLVLNTTWSLSAPQTRRRESDAMRAAAERYPKAERMLIVHEHDRRSLPENCAVVPAWRYVSREKA